MTAAVSIHCLTLLSPTDTSRCIIHRDVISESDVECAETAPPELLMQLRLVRRHKQLGSNHIESRLRIAAVNWPGATAVMLEWVDAGIFRPQHQCVRSERALRQCAKIDNGLRRSWW